MGSSDSDQWGRLVVRCDNANCRSNQPVLAEFFGCQGSSVFRPKIFQYWRPDPDEPYKEYRYGVDACPSCLQNDPHHNFPIAREKTYYALSQVWPYLLRPEGILAMKMKYGAKRRILEQTLSRDIPIFNEYDKSVNDGFLYEGTLEEESFPGFDEVLLFPMSGFMKLVQREQSVRTQLK